MKQARSPERIFFALHSLWVFGIRRRNRVRVSLKVDSIAMHRREWPLASFAGHMYRPPSPGNISSPCILLQPTEFGRRSSAKFENGWLGQFEEAQFVTFLWHAARCVCVCGPHRTRVKRGGVDGYSLLLGPGRPASDRGYGPLLPLQSSPSTTEPPSPLVSSFSPTPCLLGEGCQDQVPSGRDIVFRRPPRQAAKRVMMSRLHGGWLSDSRPLASCPPTTYGHRQSTEI
jgi:hypothetical protein